MKKAPGHLMKTYKKEWDESQKMKDSHRSLLKKKGGNLKGTESDLLFVQSCLVPTLLISVK